MDDTFIGTVDPTALTATRVELHWLAQVLGAIGDAFLERAPDDSQSNVAWKSEQSALVGRPIGKGARIGLGVAAAELLAIAADGSVAERVDARGKTLTELLAWAGDRLAQLSGASFAHSPTLRDYDMPSCAVGTGKAFAFERPAELAELARWFAAATEQLEQARGLDERASAVRCWPHHFDVGGIVMLEPDKPFEEARQLGFGWSPGDASFDEPYYYVTPFPVPGALPALPAGRWHLDGFTGAILTGSEIAQSGSQREVMATFLRRAIEQTLPLIAE